MKTCSRCKEPVVIPVEHEFCEFRESPLEFIEEWQPPHNPKKQVFVQKPITHPMAPLGARPPLFPHERYGGSDEPDNLRQDTSRKIFEER